AFELTAHSGIFPLQPLRKVVPRLQQPAFDATRLLSSFFCLFAVGNVRHDSGKLFGAAVAGDEADRSPQPDHSSIRGDHSVLKPLRALIVGDSPATRLCQRAVPRVKMID